ncbi:M6 family metalloprotease domain-containing protein [Plantactinospora sp. S1510]|uniref:M6 family metalloprotease domain-containing protein n=1 Tax=Plantactinospora alkalitolerans TaxID=2789879 RepID=A0ABS0H8C5_9ACTN|nr:M6 family metalloprotease domain-containing protein [Plantactinospora alkalitolerans]MBF9134564.1 M6 family metalloprotease domain-containing protein [Plantactinospora alkalitolerans]
MHLLSSRRTARRSVLVAAVVTALVAAAAATPATAAPGNPSGGTGPFEVLDPQSWQNPDTMTWDDYVAVPNRNWADPAVSGSVRDFRIALVTLDYPDQPFVVTQRARSTVFGNPQSTAANIPRDQVAGFYTDFLNTPNDLNKGHTLHEYWMQDSGGRYGVDLAGFGPYEMPAKSYQYGIDNGFNPGACPSGEQCARNIRTDGLGAWRAAVGEEVANSFELVFILSAGQDESSTWQEFGQMMFQTKEDVPDAWGPPDPALPNYARTRYVEWTSWKAASTIWPNAGGGSSTQAESSGMGVYAHELSHLLSIGDNYNNPYGEPLRRAYTGIWSMMSRGSFNGPGGPHTRWQIPPVNGGSMGSLHTVRDKVKIGLLGEEHLLRLSREALASSGVVVATVTARAVEAGPKGLTGINIAMNKDLSPTCDTSTDPLCDGGSYNNYTVEAVDRMGADSFTPDSGVLVSKTKNADSAPFVWVVDANPQDIDMVDFYQPNGTPQKITMGDYRQLSDALFHAGTRSGSEYEYVDQANRLHFYVLDLKRDADGVLSYTVAVRSLDGDGGSSSHGVAMSKGEVTTATRPTARGVTCSFTLTNTGAYSAGGQRHPEDVSAYLKSDVYRLSASVNGKGWRVEVPNALATAGFGRSTTVRVSVGATPAATQAGIVKLTATSESDPAKTVTKQCRVEKS